MSIFDAFEELFDEKELAESVSEINENANTYTEVPSGKYEVSVDSLEVREAPWGESQISIQFRIVEGSYKKQCIFYNQGFAEDWKRHAAVKVLNKLLNSGDNEARINLVLKSDIKNAEKLVMDIAEEIDSQHYEYLLKYTATPTVSKAGKEYVKKTYEVLEVY